MTEQAEANTRTPLQAIRAQCRWCVHDDKEEIRECPGTSCPLHPLRMGKGVSGISAMKSIRAKCRDCGDGTYQDVLDCAFNDCALYPFRLGKNPKLAGKGAGRVGNADALKQWRESRTQTPPKVAIHKAPRGSGAHEPAEG